jgi:hypothetical protein
MGRSKYIRNHGTFGHQNIQIMICFTFKEFAEGPLGAPLNRGFAFEPQYRRRYNFRNGYGISSVKFDNGWEVAVVKDGKLCYSTPITDDVIPHLEWKEVLNICKKIRKLSY